MPTDKLFTGQRLDATGLYYYGGRYYDPTIGRFISADPFVQFTNGFSQVSTPLTVNMILSGPSRMMTAPVSPQVLNRYSYVLNNPLRYTDPTGWWTLGFTLGIDFSIGFE